MQLKDIGPDPLCGMRTLMQIFSVLPGRWSDLGLVPYCQVVTAGCFLIGAESTRRIGYEVAAHD